MTWEEFIHSLVEGSRESLVKLKVVTETRFEPISKCEGQKFIVYTTQVTEEYVCCYIDDECQNGTIFYKQGRACELAQGQVTGKIDIRPFVRFQKYIDALEGHENQEGEE